MTIDVKIINKILVDQIQQHTKMNINHDQVGFIPRKQGCFSIYKPTNVNCHVKKKKRMKTTGSYQQMQKTAVKN